jgi:hypothetical protein
MATITQRIGMSRIRRVLAMAAVALSLGVPLGEASAQSLRGSSSSLNRQVLQADIHDFTYIRDGNQVQRFVEAGYLVPVRGNRNFYLKGVSFPYARPEARLFIERLSSQYMRACGERLVVTSLTRPLNRQPRNASARSVHPTGMAMDLRRSRNVQCRRWLEQVLLSLEKQGVLEATREYRPPHYHLALFPQPYARYVSLLASNDRAEASSAEGASSVTYQVRRGDSLWDIARAHGVTVDDIREANGLRGSRILPGQTLQLPVRR